MRSRLAVPFIVLMTGLLIGSSAGTWTTDGLAGRGGPQASSVSKEIKGRPRVSRVPASVQRFRAAGEVIQLIGSLRIEGRFPETAISTSGLAAASADRMTGRVWAMALRDELPPDDWAESGFKGTAFSFSGPETIRRATATATVLIRDFDRIGGLPAHIVFSVGIYKNGELIASGRAFVTGHGTLTATTTPVDLTPGSNYHLEAGLSVVTRASASSRGSVSDAEVTEIRWSF